MPDTKPNMIYWSLKNEKKENIKVQTLDIEIWNIKKFWIESNELMIKINDAAQFMFQLKIKELFNRKNDAAIFMQSIAMVIFALIFYCCVVKISNVVLSEFYNS